MQDSQHRSGSTDVITTRLCVLTYLALLAPFAQLAWRYAELASGHTPASAAKLLARPFALACVPAIVLLSIAASVSRSEGRPRRLNFVLWHLALLAAVLGAASVASVLGKLQLGGGAMPIYLAFWCSTLAQTFDALRNRDSSVRVALSSSSTKEEEGRASASWLSERIDYPLEAAKHRVLYAVSRLLGALLAAALAPVLCSVAAFVTLRLTYSGPFPYPQHWNLSELWTWYPTFLKELGHGPSPQMSAVEFQAYSYRWGLESAFSFDVLAPALWAAMAFTAVSALTLFSYNHAPPSGKPFGWLDIVRTALSRASRTALIFVLGTLVYSIGATRGSARADTYFWISLAVLALVFAARTGAKRDTPPERRAALGEDARGSWEPAD